MPLDLSFSDIWDEFDVFSFALRAEGWKQNIGWVVDGMWVDLDGDFGPGDSFGVDIEEYIVDALAGYRIAADDINVTYDLLPGLRYHYLKQEVSPGPAPTMGGSEDWIELVLGGRHGQ